MKRLGLLAGDYLVWAVSSVSRIARIVPRVFGYGPSINVRENTMSHTATGIQNPSMLALLGALIFGLVVGFIMYRTIVRATKNVKISDLATVLGAITGGGVTMFVGGDGSMFGLYAIGLAIGMAVYFVLLRKLNPEQADKLLGSGGGPRSQ